MCRGLMGQPGVLPLRIIAGCLLPATYCLVTPNRSIQPCGDLTYTDRAHYREGRVEPSFEKRDHLLGRASFDHVSESRVTSCVKCVSFGQQDQGVKVDGLCNSARALTLPFRQGSAC